MYTYVMSRSTDQYVPTDAVRHFRAAEQVIERPDVFQKRHFKHNKMIRGWVGQGVFTADDDEEVRQAGRQAGSGGMGARRPYVACFLAMDGIRFNLLIKWTSDPSSTATTDLGRRAPHPPPRLLEPGHEAVLPHRAGVRHRTLRQGTYVHSHPSHLRPLSLYIYLKPSSTALGSIHLTHSPSLPPRAPSHPQYTQPDRSGSMATNSGTRSPRRGSRWT